MNVLNEVAEWNYVRELVPTNGYEHSLGVRLLNEEVTEFFEATTRANKAKELADIIFVAYGELIKLCKVPALASDVIELVIAANNTKSKTKINGKIVKPEGYKCPEPLIEKSFKEYSSVGLFD